MSRLADYGFVLLTRVAAEPERQFTARDLAEETNLPLPTVSKLLKQLAKAGILLGHRGSNGGYGLAREPARVSVADVLSALDGPLALTKCGEGPGQCSLEAGCPTHANWLVINDAVRSVLRGLTLAQLARPLPNRIVHLTVHGKPVPSPAESRSA